MPWLKNERQDPEALPITVVSSGISSMKHFLSPSAMWKYKAEVTSKKKNSANSEETLNNSIFPAYYIRQKTIMT